MLFVAAKGAHYDKTSIERIRELTEGRKEEGHVSYTLYAYYQAILASRFCEQAAAASTLRLSNVLGETPIFHFTSRYTARRLWKC